MMKKWFWLLITFFPSCVFSQQVSVNAGAGGGGSNVGTVASNLTDASDIFSGVFSSIFYVIGIAFVVGSIMRYSEHRKNPSQTPISRVIFLLLAGLAIGFFPVMIEYMGEKTSYLNR
jgi:RsiW-degrading membrane proteinase PrsW (M82 family)